MASGIENDKALKEVLDAIYANQSTYDTYSSLKLYYNDIQRTATVFKVTEDNKTDVVAILPMKGIATATKNYMLRTLQSCVVNGTEAHVYNWGVGAYVSVDLLMKNICAFLGVRISDNFASDNPIVYPELLAIITKYYGDALDNKTPYLIKKTVIDETDEYKTYIPFNILLEFAIYLNKLGIFNIAKFIQQPTKFQYYMPIESNGMHILSLEDYLKKLVKFYSFRYYNTTNLDKEISLLTKTLNEFNVIYGNEIVPGDFLYTTLSFSSSSGVDICSLVCYEVDKTAYFTEGYTGLVNYYITYGSTNYMYIAKDGEDEDTFITKTFRFTYYDDKDTDPVYSLNVSEHPCNERYLYNVGLNGINNISNDSYFKGYFNVRPFSSSGGYHYQFNRPFPTGIININNINMLNSNDFKYVLDSKLAYNIYKSFVEDNNITFNNSDYIVFVISANKPLVMGTNINLTSSLNEFIKDLKYRVYLLKISNCPEFSYENVSTNSIPIVGSNEPYTTTYYETYNQSSITDKTWYGKALTSNGVVGYSSYRSACAFNFSNHVNYTVYKYDSDTGFSEESFENNIVSYNIDLLDTSRANTFYYSNFGGFVDNKDAEELSGMSLIDGATYPKDVIDLPSFNNIYNNIEKLAIVNPSIVDGQITTTNMQSWSPCSIGDNVSTQEMAQGGILPDGDESVKDIVQDIDDAIDNDDTESDDSDSGSDGDAKNKTKDNPDNSDDDTLMPDISKLPNPLAAGCIKQYAMSADNMKTFIEDLNSADVWSTVQKIISNPTDFIISIQCCYDYNIDGAVAEAVKFGPYTFGPTVGIRLNNFIKDLDFGVKEIPYYYNNYNDVDDVDISIYLPFVGSVPLDPSIVMGSQINVRGRLETLTGAIVYQVYCIKKKKDGTFSNTLIGQYDGNCQMQIPINSADFSRLYAAVATTALTGMSVGGQVLSQIGQNTPKSYDKWLNHYTEVAKEVSNKRFDNWNKNKGW